MASAALTLARGARIMVTEVGRVCVDRILPGGADVPRNVKGVTPAWLGEVLGAPPGAVRSVSVLDQHHGTAGRAAVAVDADPAAGLPDRVFVKFVPQALTQHVIMNVFGLGSTEVLVYSVLKDDPPIRVPHCYAARVDARRGRNVMVFEDLGSEAVFRTVVDSVTAEEAEAVADMFADLHSAFWQTDRFRTDLKPLTGRPPAETLLGDTVRKRLLGGLKSDVSRELIPKEMGKQGQVFYERSADIERLWASQPQTLLHGDTHLGNFFFEAGRPGLLDWQVSRSGPGIRDLAYFATSSTEPDLLRKIERGLVERYAARLQAAGIEVDLENLWTFYKATIAEFYLSAVSTAELGEKSQPEAVFRSGVSRVVAAVEAHDTFGVLNELMDRNR